MKNSKEYVISKWLFCVSIISFCLSGITGIVSSNTSIDKIFFYLGLSFLCCGFVFLNKSKDNNDKSNDNY